MIISASRRTDIPAFYLDWFFNRIREGYILVRNPMNYYQVSEIDLSPNVVDCIVFWTKDPTKIVDRLDELKGYNYYFQITITPYGKRLERNILDKSKVVDSFKELSRKIGKERVIWRYDPIIITEELDLDYHTSKFRELAEELSNYTELCVVSFIDLYKKTERNMKNIKTKKFSNEAMLEIAKNIVDIAKEYNLRIETCAEDIDLSSLGINHGKCIDDKLISRIVGQDINIGKDKNQREVCGCVASIDIGAYNSCKHGCLYCYANYSDKAVKDNIIKHDLDSPFLIGNSEKDDKITKRKMESYIKKFEQIKMF